MSWSDSSVVIIGITGDSPLRPVLQPLGCILGEQKLKRGFLCVPDGPVPLVGWDLLCKLNAQITLSSGKKQVCLQAPPENVRKPNRGGAPSPPERPPPSPTQACERVSTAGWAAGVPGQARSATLVRMELEEGAPCPRKRQCPLKKEAWGGVQRFSRFLLPRLMRPCRHHATRRPSHQAEATLR